MTTYQRLRDVREDRDKTQAQIAALLKTTQQQVSKWETGAACPDVTLLYDLAQLLAVTTDALLRPERK